MLSQLLKIQSIFLGALLLPAVPSIRFLFSYVMFLFATLAFRLTFLPTLSFVFFPYVFLCGLYSFGTSRRICVVIVAFPGYFHLYAYFRSKAVVLKTMFNTVQILRAFTVSCVY